MPKCLGFQLFTYCFGISRFPESSSKMRLRRLALRTERSYLGWIRRFILFHKKRHPKDMAEPEVSAFLSYLASQRSVSASTQNQALCALLFLYRHVLDNELGELDLVWARRRRKLPVILSRKESRGSRDW